MDLRARTQTIVTPLAAGCFTKSVALGRSKDRSTRLKHFFGFRTSALPRIRRAAFTLIELLIVIAIIAILAGLGFPALQGALGSSKKAQARNDLAQIVAAVKAYQLEYGTLPTADGEEFEGNNDQLLNVLRGTADQGSQLQMNPRRIAFIEPKIGIDGKFYDPWGNPYKVRLDGDYDNEIQNFYAGDSGAGWGTLNHSVIAASSGPDEEFGESKNSGSGKDDLISW